MAIGTSVETKQLDRRRDDKTRYGKIEITTGAGKSGIHSRTLCHAVNPELATWETE